ncbi:SDR family NAD(P)-dependent oxidoreductase [Tranquillimonas alkanivorans]|uniref:NAD(P)-dependent dehydrogenase, short-chain alcohol dehydrogenase family n=1 Tax=Tranquillimonas alkanivorans TaxID=441119 RepID=A0A1I5UUR9_9RHOB|nr:SDR family oxidoreductase [Tranquillimonas alkanivorans]SFP98949.1 NAD(P)-dependent dehydrogenase, short-chain alcohol dehydrogenase family [Tranquillimonas alkanivorans]
MSDYTAVITGGNKGIGADLAQRLLEQGYTVVSIARHAPDFTHERLEHVACDLLDPAAVEAAAKQIAGRHEVTHLVHNAGVIWPNLVEEAKPEDITGLAQLHLGSALTLLQAFLPAMKKRQFGRVMFNSSRAALGAATRTAYGASKAGMIGMARTWALELAKHGITVNVVAPGPILTDNFWGIVPKGSEQEADLAKRIPVGRLGRADDVSRAFLFFCDPQNGFVTGQTLYVCGGASVGTLAI